MSPRVSSVFPLCLGSSSQFLSLCPGSFAFTSCLTIGQSVFYYSSDSNTSSHDVQISHTSRLWLGSHQHHCVAFFFLLWEGCFILGGRSHVPQTSLQLNRYLEGDLEFLILSDKPLSSEPDLQPPSTLQCHWSSLLYGNGFFGGCFPPFLGPR